MHARSTIAAAALLALAAGCTTVVHQGSLGELPNAAAPIRLSEKRYTDDAGRSIAIRYDTTKGGEGAKVEGLNNGNKMDVYEIPLSNVNVCVTPSGAEAAKPLCQPLQFLTDGSSLKMGTASCTCYVITNKLYCYGDTCH